MKSTGLDWPQIGALGYQPDIEPEDLTRKVEVAGQSLRIAPNYELKMIYLVSDKDRFVRD